MQAHQAEQPAATAARNSNDVSPTVLLYARAHHHDLKIELSATSFIVCWCCVVGAHALNAGFLIATCALYFFVATPDLSYYAQLLTPQADTLLKPCGLAFGLLGAVHALKAIDVVWCSIRHRTFKFPASVEADSVSAVRHKWNIVRMAKKAWQALFGRRGLFGIESGYFDVRFMTREAIEVAAQTVQAYTSSTLIGRTWINDLYVCTIVLNCWSTPVLQHYTRHSPSLERIVCLAADACLDSVTTIWIPLIVIAPYCTAFNGSSYLFELDQLYDDVWFANLVFENRQLFATSVGDFIWTFIPHLSILSCLSSVKALVQCHAFHKSAAVHCDAPMAAHHNTTVAELEELFTKVKFTERTTPSQRRLRHRSLTMRMQDAIKRGFDSKKATAAHILLFFWGLGVLFVHLQALVRSHNVASIGCKQPLRPWFTPKPACSVYEFNCYDHGVTTVDGDALSTFEPSTMAALIIAHCSQLEVTSAINRYDRLIGLEVYNSTIVTWDADAAITEATHPTMTYLFLIRMNASEIPKGILQGLPPVLQDIEICVTNLTTIPADLDVLWPGVMTLYFEMSAITNFPGAVRRMGVSDGSFVGNQIVAVPSINDTTFMPQNFAMSGNPIDTMPAELGDVSELGNMYLEDTLITSIEPWLGAWGDAVVVYMGRTPYCKQQPPDPDQPPHVTCTPTAATLNPRYPLDLMTGRRQITI
ncbi:TPA: hypothetical protein N0F65_008222 [Lagenidium giganteum]|uniref:Uncharacterized protein n=1 Tax=Lagenidium giganteum TaxID=4803 RepID=A0AAV2Z0F1_9STRA|nr:TPA: hypothetical protein N0F65_008222 [Lagenidium giganteum]